jgi:hypothetical protein
MDITSIGTSVYGTSQTGQMQGPPAPPSKAELEDMTDRLIQDKDSDGDGLLSAAEIDISEEAFALADTDGDGALSRDELIAGAETIGKELGPKGPPPELGAQSEDESQTLSLDVLA